MAQSTHTGKPGRSRRALAALALVTAVSGVARSEPGASGAWPWTTPGLWGEAPTLDERVELERCAMGTDPATPSAACVRVLGALAVEREELHRALRAVVRRGSPDAVREAAAGLALMPELQSGDLYLWALLRERGPPLAAPLLIEAWERGQPPWVGATLRYLAAFAPDATTRAVAAGRILRQRQLELERVGALLTEVEALLAELDASQDDDPRRALAAELTLAAARIRGLCTLVDAGGGVSATRCPWWRAPPAPPLWAPWPRPRCAPPRADYGAAGAYAVAAALACAAEPDPRVFHQAIRLAQRFPKRRRPPIETLLRGSEGTRSVPPLRHPGEVDPVDPFAEVAALPSGFWGFDPELPQPSWYPAHVHLTIDDGPRPTILAPTLDVLDAHGVKATFFFVGSAVLRRTLNDPDATGALLRRVVADGHLVGFHSMHHSADPEEHEANRGPDQFTDSVALFRALLERAAGAPIPVRYGRHAGGRGALFETMPRDFAAAGLSQHVLWTFGFPYWSQTSPVATVRELACPLAASEEAVVVLLHEFPRLPEHLAAFFVELRGNCSADAGAHRPVTRASFRGDEVFDALRAPSTAERGGAQTLAPGERDERRPR